MFFEISQGKHLCQSLLFNKVARRATLSKKEALALVFSCEFCEISKKFSTFLQDTSGRLLLIIAVIFGSNKFSSDNYLNLWVSWVKKCYFFFVAIYGLYIMKNIKTLSNELWQNLTKPVFNRAELKVQPCKLKKHR